MEFLNLVHHLDVNRQDSFTNQARHELAVLSWIVNMAITSCHLHYILILIGILFHSLSDSCQSVRSVCFSKTLIPQGADSKAQRNLPTLEPQLRLFNFLRLKKAPVSFNWISLNLRCLYDREFSVFVVDNSWDDMFNSLGGWFASLSPPRGRCLGCRSGLGSNLLVLWSQQRARRRLWECSACPLKKRELTDQ